jgi:uncharacterized protein YerC
MYTLGKERAKMKKSNTLMNRSLKKELTANFVRTLVDLKSEQEAREFVNSFFTDAEQDVFVKRLGTAYFLFKKKSYEDIQSNLNVSSATIASVKSMSSKSGFAKAIKNLLADEWANVWAQKIRNVVGIAK